MDYSNFFGGLIAEIKSLYLQKGANEVCFWMVKFSSKFLPDGLRQKLREYEDSDLYGESLSINLIGRNEITIRVGSNGHLMVWEIKVCS